MSQYEIQSESPSYGTPAAPSKEEKPPEPAKLGPHERLIGTLLSPGETFQDVNRKPTWLAPLLISIVMTLAFSAFFEWRVKPDWDKFFRTITEKQLGQPLRDLPAERQAQINKQIEWQKMFAKTDFSSPLTITIAVGKMVIYYVFAFILTASVFALGLMLMAAQTTFKKILSVVAWSWCATALVSILVTAAALMVRDSESLRDYNIADPGGIVPTNLAVILPSGTSAVLTSIASSIDIFSIWFLILLSIGFAAIAGAKKFTSGKTAPLVFGLWVIWVLIQAGFAALGFGGR